MGYKTRKSQPGADNDTGPYEPTPLEIEAEIGIPRENRERLMDRVDKAQRLRSLRNRLAILDNVRGTLLTEIQRTEQNMRSLVHDYGAYERAASPGAVRADRAMRDARKALGGAVDTLARGDFGYGLQTALTMLVMLPVDDEPRLHKDEILYAAVVRAGAEEPSISKTEKNRIYRELRERFGFVDKNNGDTEYMQERFRAAVKRGRRKVQKRNTDQA